MGLCTVNGRYFRKEDAIIIFFSNFDQLVPFDKEDGMPL